jgi:hypothetical protein
MTSAMATAVTVAAMATAMTVAAMTNADARAVGARVELEPLNPSLATALAPAAPLRLQLLKHPVIVLLSGGGSWPRTARGCAREKPRL